MVSLFILVSFFFEDFFKASKEQITVNETQKTIYCVIAPNPNFIANLSQTLTLTRGGGGGWLYSFRTSFYSTNDCYTLAKKFIFNFRIYKIFSYLPSFAKFNSINLYLLLRRSRILNVSNVLFSK